MFFGKFTGFIWLKTSLTISFHRNSEIEITVSSNFCED